MARNIHIMGRREGPPEPTVIFTPEASEETVLAAWTPTGSSCAYRLTLGVYAAESRGIHYGTHYSDGSGHIAPEQAFREAGWDVRTPLPDGWACTPDAVAAAMAKVGCTILGPPPCSARDNPMATRGESLPRPAPW